MAGITIIKPHPRAVFTAYAIVCVRTGNTQAEEGDGSEAYRRDASRLRLGLTLALVKSRSRRVSFSHSMLAFRASLRSVTRPLATRALQRPVAVFSRIRVATFASSAGLEKSQIQTRIIDVLKGFEKVDPAKARPLVTPALIILKRTAPQTARGGIVVCK